MAYKIRFADPRIWKKDCAKIPRNRLRLIFQSIRKLANDPWPDNIQVKQLKDYPVADFRLRIGEYRILFDKDDERKIIDILRVLHRSKLY